MVPAEICESMWVLVEQKDGRWVLALPHDTLFLFSTECDTDGFRNAQLASGRAFGREVGYERLRYHVRKAKELGAKYVCFNPRAGEKAPGVGIDQVLLTFDAMFLSFAQAAAQKLVLVFDRYWKSTGQDREFTPQAALEALCTIRDTWSPPEELMEAFAATHEHLRSLVAAVQAHEWGGKDIRVLVPDEDIGRVLTWVESKLE